MCDIQHDQARNTWPTVYFHSLAWLFLQVFMPSATFVRLNLLNNTPSSSKLDQLLPQWSMAVLTWVAGLVPFVFI
ncbi:hypothetical protein C7N83_12470 [Neisseria iguanae]|uniref:Uncharacterized protein n=1 Tax=Neisseria iguanae TaxID=90242 RepID=A0A2P7TXE7_9NEIS|nr:hypothetical protein C7N83_12470 [Neisseria iguanae]